MPAPYCLYQNANVPRSIRLHVDGIRIFFVNRGSGHHFSWAALFIALGAGAAYFGVASVLVELMIVNLPCFMNTRHLYKLMKFQVKAESLAIERFGRRKSILSGVRFGVVRQRVCEQHPSSHMCMLLITRRASRWRRRTRR